MGILLGFAPFVAFAVLSGSLPTATCLWIATAVATIPIVKELAHRRFMKVLEVGTLVLFAGLAAYTGIAHARWEIWAVRTIVDGEAAEMSVHNFDGHLHRIEVEAMLLRHCEHVEVNVRIFVAGEADESDLPCLLRIENRLHTATLAKDAVRIVETDDLVVLKQIDLVRLEALQ